jgi:hypothetical protein
MFQDATPINDEATRDILGFWIDNMIDSENVLDIDNVIDTMNKIDAEIVLTYC